MSVEERRVRKEQEMAQMPTIPAGHLEALTEIETTTQRMATAEKMTMTREGEAEVQIGVKGEGHEIRAETKTEREGIDAATVMMTTDAIVRKKSGKRGNQKEVTMTKTEEKGSARKNQTEAVAPGKGINVAGKTKTLDVAVTIVLGIVRKGMTEGAMTEVIETDLHLLRHQAGMINMGILSQIIGETEAKEDETIVMNRVMAVTDPFLALKL